ncbi:hypothetical protein [Brazilian marseillevirus]|uniref:hypothetical protein n=1 Tax=Brazilian marseillevirus TaxID=1813599 RepID=UPI0007867AA3|nr:hypothetical protein A3303_gp070 [Brazilian marseillevirus]AMQ10578.1 hypothetical protein [Brazilian marseillevirus]
MYASPLDELENDDALLFRGTIEKQLERIEGRLYRVEKELEKNLEYEEHNKVWRRKKHLERFSNWLRDSLQDLDDIHKGVPWKHSLKVGMMNRERSTSWYEWKDPKERVVPQKIELPVVSKKESQPEKESTVEKEQNKRRIRGQTKEEALHSLGYDPSFISALGL